MRINADSKDADIAAIVSTSLDWRSNQKEEVGEEKTKKKGAGINELIL